MFDLNFELHLILNLVVAAALGALIGYERELRAKGAGIRTHVMVALGAALFMVVSKYAFDETMKFDAARVAAGVVTGIGFIGGGIIMKKKHVSGLTTAAALWVTGAIGLGAGGGMYIVSGVCTAIVLICLEGLHFYNFKLGDKVVTTVVTSTSAQTLTDLVGMLGKEVSDFSLSKDGDRYKAEIALLIKKKETASELIARLTSVPGIDLESLE